MCSAVLVGMMIASEVRRAYRTSGTTADRPATGAFGTGRSIDEPVAAQHERAQESGRGRHAQAPWQIPSQGWKDILWRTYEQIGEDRLLAVAATSVPTTPQQNSKSFMCCRSGKAPGGELQ